jgi:phosphoribosylanthranilate isomerase
MTLVKICGITQREDADCALECGADALGFVFAKSPREVTPSQARAILDGLSPGVVSLGVFVNRPASEVRAVLSESGCRVAQLHGDEGPRDLKLLAPYPVVKVLRVRNAMGEEALAPYREAFAILLDTYSPKARGGTGQRFEESFAAGLVAKGWRIIIAGGLTPDNVAEVVSRVRPFAVDVSTGVESAPGRKDHAKIRDFVAAVRAADRI